MGGAKLKIIRVDFTELGIKDVKCDVLRALKSP